MTSIETTIIKINQKLISAFAMLDGLLDHEQLFQTTGDDGSVLQQIEDILFQNQIILQEVKEAVRKATALRQQGVFKPGRYTLTLDKEILASTPQRIVTNVDVELQSSPETLRLLLRDQLYRCLHFLDQLSSGQGKLVTVKLPLENTIVLDPYQALYFVALNTQRQITSIDKIVSRMDACSTY